MQDCYQQDNALIRRSNYETLRIEPWGRDSLRVRATINGEIRDDLVSALLPAQEAKADIEINGDAARIRNGAISAEVSSIRQLRGAGGRLFDAVEQPPSERGDQQR